MGMYTEIYLTVQIIDNPPKDVIDVLLSMFGEGKAENLPDHPFFKKQRWNMVGKSSSFYFVPKSTTEMFETYGNWYITSRSDLKNYDGEIEAFFDWIMPFIHAPEGQFIGYSRYEEHYEPKLYYKIKAQK